MASVSSLDKDLRKMRLDKYTPAAANEARSWIEGILGTQLPSKDLLEGLKDGVALCKLVNLAVGPPGVKFKQSAMPFVQMENISHFLRACKSPPLNLQEHDVFLTVDLYEQKDPAQVLQCLGAFSRAANAVNPSAFPEAIGPRARGAGAGMSPQQTGGSTTRARGMSNVSAASPTYGARSGLAPSNTGGSGSGRWSPTKSPTFDRVGSPTTSSWSKKLHEGVTDPAWNIAQYGYMGGASQGNLGIAFGGRRQITSASPHVPNMAEKERRRKEQEAEAERQRLQMLEEERLRKEQAEAEERRAQLEEERRWEEATRRQRAEEKRKADEEKRRWEDEERQWRLTEEKRRQEEEEAEARLADERKRSRDKNDNRLHGQFLSQYQAEQSQKGGESDYSDRIKQLERELEEARRREQEYEEERQRRTERRDRSKSRARSRSRPNVNKIERPPSRQDSWRRADDEREFLTTQHQHYQQQQEQYQQDIPPPAQPLRPLPQQNQPQQQYQQEIAPAQPPRPLPQPSPLAVQKHRTGERERERANEGYPAPLQAQPQAPMVKPQRTGEARPLPVPGPVQSQKSGHTTLGTSSRPLPVPQSQPQSQPNLPPKPQPNPKSQAPSTGGWGGKSLLEREMEMERQRQREWEEAQKETAQAVRSQDGVEGIGGGIGGRWDVSQWSGFMGGDSQNKGSAGIGAGRRQIVGPRPLPGRP
ncbi:hypothetical protein F5Y16DRAFT_378520 [Xylariaceae sp. FL0255]|nr:hypothetical protein F5Y16DRAFT_378520 [Xylariaceae sp. FL0255]